jgi:hypothetical protein
VGIEWLDDISVGQWLHSRRRWAEAASILLPSIGSIDFADELQPAKVRGWAGVHVGHAMLDAFAHGNYATAIQIAGRIDREFKDTHFHTHALKLMRELPQRTEDFRSFKLPSPQEWKAIKSRLTRVQQIDYLCERIRLMRRGHTGQRMVKSDTDLTGSEVINPLVELGGQIGTYMHGSRSGPPEGLSLTISDIQYIAPHMEKEWSTMRFPTFERHPYRPSVNYQRALITPRQLLVPIINRVAKHDLSYLISDHPLSQFDLRQLGIEKLTEALVATEIQRIIAWSREKQSATPADISLAAVEAGLRRKYWASVRGAAKELISAKDKRIAPLLAQFLEADIIERQKVEILIALEDVDGALATKAASGLLRSDNFGVRAAAAGVATKLPEYRGAGPALKFIRSKGDGVKDQHYPSVVSALAKSRAPDSKKLLMEITGFDAAGVTRWPDGSARVQVIRSLSDAGLPHGLKHYRTLLDSNEPAGNFIPVDMPPIKVGNGRFIAPYIAFEIIHQYAPKDGAIVAIREETTEIGDRVSRLKAWLDGKIQKMSRP